MYDVRNNLEYYKKIIYYYTEVISAENDLIKKLSWSTIVQFALHGIMTKQCFINNFYLGIL